jgi:hypothetical protein
MYIYVYLARWHGYWDIIKMTMLYLIVYVIVFFVPNVLAVSQLNPMPKGGGGPTWWDVLFVCLLILPPFLLPFIAPAKAISVGLGRGAISLILLLSLNLLSYYAPDIRQWLKLPV